MKKIAVNFGWLIILSVFGITDLYSQVDKFIPMISTIITPDKGKDMLRQYSRPTPKKINDFFILTPGSIDTLLLNFNKIKTVKSEDGKKIKSLNNYGFQYLGVVIKDKKYIYINAFYVKSAQLLTVKYKNWQTDPVVNRKGGKSFWGVLFDIEAEKFYELEINESA